MMLTLILIVLLVALMIPLAAVILDSQVGRALAARLEGRELAGAQATRLTVLESEVDRLSKELSRLEEESEFLHRLLEERSAGESLLPPGDSDLS